MNDSDGTITSSPRLDADRDQGQMQDPSCRS
jgi:hypothetical protein